MPNYTLSRTSPPAHIYERKLNLGYGIKVDTSDAPQPNKEKKMENLNAKPTVDVADLPVDPAEFTPVNGQTVALPDTEARPEVKG